jgi:hypothetical protein
MDAAGKGFGPTAAMPSVSAADRILTIWGSPSSEPFSADARPPSHTVNDFPLLGRCQACYHALTASALRLRILKTASKWCIRQMKGTFIRSDSNPRRRGTR